MGLYDYQDIIKTRPKGSMTNYQSSKVLLSSVHMGLRTVSAGKQRHQSHKILMSMHTHAVADTHAHRHINTQDVAQTHSGG